MKDDDTLTDEERAAIGRAWRELVEEKAHNGKLHYSPVLVRGMPAPGSYRIPRDVFEAVGQGDIKMGAAAIHAMLGVEDFPERPDLIDPLAVRILGDGSLAAGRRVLDRFVQMVRRQGAQSDVIPQPDGNHGRVVRHPR
jgi:hypothetical protein